ncbi:hypothetical protein PMAYCL1PPCAC_01758, partial [Pristionchus mayeri]
QVTKYERKSPLDVADRGLGSLAEVQPADCIVCFSKKTIFGISQKLEMMGIKPAVIYGDLPPGTKMAQADKFNDPNDPCNVLVATDAIGMGLNLNIRRVIFAAVTRQGKLLPSYAAKQIAGRAGRYGTAHEGGVVTTQRPADLSLLKQIMDKPIEPIEAVGIAPTFDQIETFSFHLPTASFVRLLDIFVSVCSVSDHFFICTVEQMKTLATAIDNIELALKIRYTLCTCPIDISDNKYAETVFIKMARRLSSGNPLTADWFFDIVRWPAQPVKNLGDLARLESLYEVLDNYLWLSLRFPDMLPDGEIVMEARKQVDKLISEGMENMSKLLAGMGNGKEGSIRKTSERKGRSARDAAEQLEEEEEQEDEEEEEEEKPKPKQKLKTQIVLPSKRKGMGRKSKLENLMERGVLSKEDVETLKKEVRATMVKEMKEKE